MQDRYVVGLAELDGTQLALAGGKAAQLGALSRIGGVRVPEGFCVTTSAYRRIVAAAGPIDGLVAGLAGLDPADRDAIAERSAAVRRTLEGVVVPDDVAAAIVDALARLDGGGTYAVRSSATAEDMPTASFAGQHDSYLDLVGPEAVVRHVGRACASLFGERAVAYRLRNGFDHRTVEMAVVVQRMVDAQAAGVLFTADPATGNRRVAAIEAAPGLAEALVSGRVEADAYRVRDGEVVARTVREQRPALTDVQAVELAALGRRIEQHLGRPQDIEWCLDDDGFAIVQSRPITTLFPVPPRDDDGPHVYVSVGHQQMMTDPMRALGLSMWQLTARPTMHEAGGRLFVDVTPRLASPASRTGFMGLIRTSDPLMGDALQTLLDRGFVPEATGGPAGPPVGGAPSPVVTDPAIVAELVARVEASVAACARDIRSLRGSALLDFILADIEELKRLQAEPENMQAVMAGMEAAWWLNERLEAWLGERNVADALAQSTPGNVSSEMGLALLDVADAIRPHPAVVAFLEQVEDDGFLDELPALPGGPEARAAIVAYLDRYGMRCVGEIDITRPRWSERPSTLVPLILGNVERFEPGDGPRRFEQGLRAAREREAEVLARLRALPDGASKADQAKRMIDRLRTFAGYREHPKYHIVSRYLVYKRALLEEAGRLVRAGVLREPEDCFHLTFEELREVVRTQRADDALIAERRQAFEAHPALTPPRVLTSEGEALTGAYRRDGLPDGALTGLAVSRGTVEGRARVVHDLSGADLRDGDILVTTHTDPSWSPLFVAIAGLVTEVGGIMTHGAVVAREYGLPAVVGVEHATRLIEDGRRIRVHGTDGYVEILA